MHKPRIIRLHSHTRLSTLLLNLTPAPNTPILHPRLLGFLVPQPNRGSQRLLQARQRPSQITLPVQSIVERAACRLHMAADDLDAVHVMGGRVLSIDDFLVRVDQVAVLTASLVTVQAIVGL